MKIIAIGLFAFAIISCTNNVGELAPCNVSDKVLYFTDVYPIIDRTCAIPNCHVNGSQHGNFKNADEVKKVADNGRLEFMIVTRQMPAGITSGPSFLTDCEINIISKWIKNGASIN